MNCIQNQVTLNDVTVIRDKVASLIILGGKDNVQGVAGQMLAFFSELGFTFQQFPFVACGRGRTAEDMENNLRFVQTDVHLREGTRAFVARAVTSARGTPACDAAPPKLIPCGGRMASASAKYEPHRYLPLAPSPGFVRL